MVKRASITYSKLREQLGCVGVETKRLGAKTVIMPKMARQWKVENIVKMVSDVVDLHDELRWGDTYIEQESGEYLISLLKRDIPIKVISTMKKVRDPKMLERIKIMDRIEMTEFLRQLKLNGQLLFPRKRTAHMRRLEEQMPYWTKHVTEAGSIDYWSPGEEPDDLVRSLMIDCFSLRGVIENRSMEHVGGGIPKIEADPDLTQDFSFSAPRLYR